MLTVSVSYGITEKRFRCKNQQHPSKKTWKEAAFVLGLQTVLILRHVYPDAERSIGSYSQ